MNYIYTRSSPFCPWCERVKALLDGYGIPYDVEDISASEEALKEFTEAWEFKSVPQVFLNGKYIGGFEATAKYLRGES